jgi:hypothetical protein
MKTLLVVAVLAVSACDPYIDLGALSQSSLGGSSPTSPSTSSGTDAGTQSDGGSCPDPSDPKVHYMGNSNVDAKICLVIDFGCESHQRGFSDLCGCGCIDK